MAKGLGIFIIHGMGSPEPSYAEGLIRRLSSRLNEAGQEVEFESCYWSPILQEQQDVTWRRLLKSKELDAKALRRWIVSALGDPASYLSGYFKENRPVYGDVHECVRFSLARLSARVGRKAPLMVLAHSLGSVVVSNYIWDENHGTGIGRNPFEKMETLTSLITYGSNIPLFLPPAPPITCIRFPHPKLPAKLRAVARWKNVYDPDDVLGYPLENIWDITQGTRIEDIAINAGVWPLSALPFSHTGYDKDDDFLDIVEAEARAILLTAS